MVAFAPKQIFQETADAKAHHELVVSSAFQRAGLAALQSYADILTRSGDSEAASKFHKLAGAREFWGVLLNLTEKPETTKQPVVQQNLNHRI